MSHNNYGPRLDTPAYPTIYARDFDRQAGWWPDLARTCHGRLWVEPPSMAGRQKAVSDGLVFCLMCGRTYAYISAAGWRDGRR